LSRLDKIKFSIACFSSYEPNQSALDDAAKADLNKLAAIALSTKGYLIKIAGYTSSTGTHDSNQKLSDERATTVANYLRARENIPMRRILVPAGNAAMHPPATNADAQGRAQNRRVDVRILVNKRLNAQM
jgi:outer membrane protein OmpA-like peptidoglycan-associated protein